MIFVTVGTQLPFDRMIRAVDEWAAESGRRDVFAQIGDGGYTPAAIEWVRFLTPDETACRLQEADLIVAHAGMGTIISALQMKKPIVVFPRRAELGEHRNDHQLATAKRFGERGLVWVVENVSTLGTAMGDICGSRAVGGGESPQRLRLVRFLAAVLALP